MLIQIFKETSINCWCQTWHDMMKGIVTKIKRKENSSHHHMTCNHTVNDNINKNLLIRIKSSDDMLLRESEAQNSTSWGEKRRRGKTSHQLVSSTSDLSLELCITDYHHHHHLLTLFTNNIFIHIIMVRILSSSLNPFEYFGISWHHVRNHQGFSSSWALLTKFTWHHQSSIDFYPCLASGVPSLFHSSHVSISHMSIIKREDEDWFCSWKDFQDNFIQNLPLDNNIIHMWYQHPPHHV